MKSVSLVLPLLAPRPDVRALLASWSKALGNAVPAFEILLIDDTNALAPDEPWLKELAGVHLVKHAAPLGLGLALQTGIDLARHEWIMAAVADRQFTPADALKLLKTQDADVIAAYRLRPVPGWLHALDLCKRGLSRVLLGDVPEPRDTFLGTSGFGRRLMARRLFGVGLRDPECGLLLAKRSLFKRLRIQSRGPFAWIEMLAKANHLGMMLAEVPVGWHEEPRPSSNVARDAHAVFHHPDFVPPPYDASPKH